MTIKSLEVVSFRNYENQALYFSDAVNILYGQNAQGKTNILEALYMASTGKSHRTNNYQDLVQYDKPGFEIRLTAVIDNRENKIVIRYAKDKGRYAEINGVKRDKLSDILGTLNIILFSPETMEVIKGSPAIRRRFMDILLCQTNRQYLHSLQQYNLLIKNKSAALKKGRSEKKYEDVIPIWNNHIAHYGGIIANTRHQAIKKLNLFMKQEMKQITDSKETSELIYKTFCSYDDDVDEKYFQIQLKERLDQGVHKEMNLAQCLYGPHRDDIEILLNGMNSRQYCSQGQQRTLALSLIIAELLFVEETRGEKPVLLLDDVMSELDSSRQEYLVQGLYDVQTIITTTDKLPFNNIKGRAIKSFYIENGSAAAIS